MTLSLEITTVIGCRNACSFCPQKTLVSNYNSFARYLSPDTLEKCLRTVPKDVRIDFSGYAEPFFSNFCGQLMLLVKKLGFRMHLYTTLMGIRHEDWESIRSAECEHIRIHVPDQKGLVLDDEEWINQHELMLIAGLKGTYMAMGEMTPRVSEYMREIGIEVEMPTMLSRGGNLWKPHPYDRIHCNANRWHQNVLLPDGSVYLCCMDYGLTCPMGNLTADSYERILELGEGYKKKMAENAQGTICASCEWSTQA